jgi:FMN phosphatase YigB (HAD superfamily)
LKAFIGQLERNEKGDMGRRFELIVFDWDGTLMDSTGAIVNSIKAAATDLGIEPPSEERAGTSSAWA